MKKSSILPADPASFEQPVSDNKKRKRAISLTYQLTITKQARPPKSTVLRPHTHNKQCHHQNRPKASAIHVKD